MQAKNLTIMIKPVSDTCQMNCRYCFYHDLSRFGAPTGRKMQETTVDALLGEVKANLAPDGEVMFAFQGGEPLLAGPDFYESFFGKAAASGINASYVFQTNGLEIVNPITSSGWIRLFKNNRCLIGLSIDGPQELHDSNRTDSSGGSTHSKVMAAYNLLISSRINVNILTVLSREVMAEPEKLFEFYREIKASDVQLIPCLPEFGKRGERLSGEFLVRFYDLWRSGFADGVPPFEVREFNAILNALSGHYTDTCIFSGRCTPQLVVEADGSLYPCDFFVLPKFRTGKISINSLDSTLSSDGMKKFIQIDRKLPQNCINCRFSRLCGGGCVRMREAWQPDLPDCPMQKLLNHIIFSDYHQNRS